MTGPIYCLVDRTLRTGHTREEDYISLSFSFCSTPFLSLSAFSLSPPSPQSISLSHLRFLPFSLSPPTLSSTPLTYLLKDIWLSFNSLFLSLSLPLSVCLSLLTCRIFPLCLIILSLGQSVSHRVLQWQRCCRYCAATLRNA